MAETRAQALENIRFGLKKYLYYYTQVIALPFRAHRHPDQQVEQFIASGLAVIGDPDDAAQRIAEMQQHSRAASAACSRWRTTGPTSPDDPGATRLIARHAPPALQRQQQCRPREQHGLGRLSPHGADGRRPAGQVLRRPEACGGARASDRGPERWPSSLAPFLERRRRFAEAVGDALAIIPGAREAARNADTDFEFRQDSDFYFLTGFDEPDAVAVFNPSHAKERFVLFACGRAIGSRRSGPAAPRRHRGAIATYGADAAYTHRRAGRAAPRVRHRPASALRLPAGQSHLRRPRTRSYPRCASGRAASPRSGAASRIPGPSSTSCACAARPMKLPPRRALRRSAAAPTPRPCASRGRASMSTEVQAALEFVFRKGGSPRNAYPSIVASGPNACILHYNENRRRMEDGDLFSSTPAANGAISRPTSPAPFR